MLISEMERVVFSIIIPCRNASKTIKRCLESIFKGLVHFHCEGNQGEVKDFLEMLCKGLNK